MTSVVEISPLTRVEGHGTVKIYLDGPRVEKVELCLTESPRLFEALLIGKGFAEVPEIVCRICSLCSTVHKVTALLAVEDALGVRVSESTRLTRELILNGGLIQSHALHLYCLMLPDLFEVRGVSDLAQKAPELLKAGLAVKRVGNLIQETVGGRLIHPVNIRLGGLGRRIGRDELLLLKDELQAIMPACRDTVPLFSTPFSFPPLPAPAYLALASSDPVSTGDAFLWGDGSFPVHAYRERIEEVYLPHTRAKQAQLEGNFPTVGPLSRLNLGAVTGTEASPLFEGLRPELTGSDIRGGNLARAVELIQAVERSLSVIEELLAPGRDASREADAPVRGTALPGSDLRVGTAACEAPRGSLIHSYAFDEAGRCKGADVITPTSLNQGAISRDLLVLARAMEGAERPQLIAALERLVRCYDPCISCSVHLVTL